MRKGEEEKRKDSIRAFRILYGGYSCVQKGHPVLTHVTLLYVLPLSLLLPLFRLLKLDLKSCDQLTNDACEVVAKIKTLQRLFLGGLANITDEGVQKLLPLEDLTHVSMYVCDSATR